MVKNHNYQHNMLNKSLFKVFYEARYDRYQNLK
jgi:hypothetical protein